MAVTAGGRSYESARSVGGFKSNFFDSAKVLAAMDRTTHKALSKLGAFVRQRARSSIRKAPKADARTGIVVRGRKKKGVATVDATARPGKPPYGHGDQKLKKFIYFAYDPKTKTVIIGPAKFPNPRGGGPEFLEKGGATTIRDRRGRARPANYAGNPVMVPALAAELPKAQEFFREAGF